eukprot:TRINITY_DN2839_c0_g1_i1.p1 TRINITY_DN2839_c0_g1~~TRINITY_DN2839_c0_g1_i1.p1  ORF type:complete len:161 (+),score=5.60 TRINITY_DN2839_c0_g1_i1:150-632(+)
MCIRDRYQRRVRGSPTDAMSMLHQQHPSLLTERTGRVASELGIALASHPLPVPLLHNNFCGFEHPDHVTTRFHTGDRYSSRGAASSANFEPYLRSVHPPSDIAYVRHVTGPSGPVGRGPVLPAGPRARSRFAVPDTRIRPPVRSTHAQAWEPKRTSRFDC